ncbi:hypothetical protein MAPG_04945 [Magnaporthiopsis poae ATCC 64411]|uniref:Uncharacterized protein n=1 Tax=Magnaporthiopsis poae (strain ATCC 64411 / 73-15) TaxID=644358 RepID=A0A0C4DY36_MAGP6|nr:hypothetical protein MAPG_04945 [Magnaporthiopsis poae ATCC 64411]
MSALASEAGFEDGDYVVVFAFENPATHFLLMNKTDQESGQIALRVREIQDGDPIPLDLVLKMPLRDDPEPETTPAVTSRLQQHLEEWDRHFSSAQATRRGTPFLDLYRSTNIVRSKGGASNNNSDGSVPVPVTLWDFCGGGSLASLLASCDRGGVEVPAAMGAILVVDVLTALLTTLGQHLEAHQHARRPGPAAPDHHDPPQGDRAQQRLRRRGRVRQPAVPIRFGCAGYDLPRYMLGDFARRRPVPRPAAEAARWTRMNDEMDSCCAKLEKLGAGAAATDTDLAAVLEGTLCAFRALEKEALDKTSAEQDAFLAQFRAKVRQHWQRQRPHPLGFDSAEKADRFCAEELKLKPCTWRARRVVGGKIQLPK